MSGRCFTKGFLFGEKADLLLRNGRLETDYGAILKAKVARGAKKKEKEGVCVYRQ